MIINAIFIWKLQHSASVKGCHCGPAGQEAVVLEIVRFTLTTHVSDCKKEDAHSLFIIGSLRKDDDTANENIKWKSVGKRHDLFLAYADIRYLPFTNAIFSWQIGSFFFFL